MPEVKEMEISTEAPSILAPPEKSLDADQQTALEVSSSAPTMPPLGDDVQNALVEDPATIAPTSSEAQEDIPVTSEATQQPLGETSTFSELGEIGMTDAAPAVQEAYNKLPDVEESPPPVSHDMPGAFHEDEPDQAVDEPEEPRTTYEDPIEESPAKTSDQDEQPLVTGSKVDVEPA
ncbi:MAG: hypothetical protein Q9183_007569, partial [Haloplaca sp. 2 TL-2023]